MIDQEMLDYLHSRLSAGSSKESIIQSLRTSGWSNENIREAFAANRRTRFLVVAVIYFFVALGSLTIVPTIVLCPPTEISLCMVAIISVPSLFFVSSIALLVSYMGAPSKQKVLISRISLYLPWVFPIIFYFI